MVWNPLRLLKTLVHFEVVGPLGNLLSSLPGITDSGTPVIKTLDPVDRVPWPTVWLMGEAARWAAPLSQRLEPLDYRVTTQALEHGPALVNVPLVVVQAELIPDWVAMLKPLATYQESTLADFRQPNPATAALWGSLDDGVMGGVSASQVQWQQGLRFVGQVSTANSGGFASIRTRNLEPPLNLAQWQGAVLHVQGDGQRYKWILRDNPGWDSLAYCRSFDTEAQQMTTVRIPFLDMVATRRARTVPEASSLNPAQLHSMQLMLSKFEYDGDLNPAFHAGAFSLTVERLGVYRQGPKPVVVLPEGNAEMGPQLAEAGLTGVIPQGSRFAVIGANDKLPPEVTPAAVETILAAVNE